MLRYVNYLHKPRHCLRLPSNACHFDLQPIILILNNFHINKPELTTTSINQGLIGCVVTKGHAVLLVEQSVTYLYTDSSTLATFLKLHI